MNARNRALIWQSLLILSDLEMGMSYAREKDSRARREDVYKTNSEHS